jgi:hypothetical protein
MFFLMAQAVLSRVFVPGVSIFVNSSVRCRPHRTFASVEPRLHCANTAQQYARKSTSHAPQILDCDAQSSAANGVFNPLSDL